MKWNEWLLVAGLAAAGLVYSCNKRLEVDYSVQMSDPRPVRVSVEKAETEEFVPYIGGYKATVAADKVLTNAWDEMRASGARLDDIAFDRMVGVASVDMIITKEEAVRISEFALNPRCELGKLWVPYAGPARVPVLSRDDVTRMRRFYEQYSVWRPMMVPLIDENGDGFHSEDELNRAAYKVLYQ